MIQIGLIQSKPIQRALTVFHLILWQYEVEGEGKSKCCVIGYRLLTVVIAPLLLNVLSLRSGNCTLSDCTLLCVLTIHVHNDTHTYIYA
jgi:hypothetical protein